MLALLLIRGFYVHNIQIKLYLQTNRLVVGLGGLGVTFWPRNPRFAGSNPTEVDGFFSGRKNPEHKSSGKNFKLEIPSLRFQAR